MTKIYGSYNYHYFPFIMIIGPDIGMMTCTISSILIINIGCLVYDFLVQECVIGGSINGVIAFFNLFFYFMAAFSDSGAIPRILNEEDSKNLYSKKGRVLRCSIIIFLIK